MAPTNASEKIYISLLLSLNRVLKLPIEYKNIMLRIVLYNLSNDSRNITIHTLIIEIKLRMRPNVRIIKTYFKPGCPETLLSVFYHEWKTRRTKPLFRSLPKPSKTRATRFLVAVNSTHHFLQYINDSTKACDKYTEAIALDAENQFLYSNRAAALVKLGKLDAALADALR